MLGISFEFFESIINALRLQRSRDKDYSLSLGVVLGSDLGLYDNSLLQHKLIEFLQNFFEKEEDGCLIEHYCWVLDFGFDGDVRMSILDLWNSLTLNKKNALKKIV